VFNTLLYAVDNQFGRFRESLTRHSAVGTRQYPEFQKIPIGAALVFLHCDLNN